MPLPRTQILSTAAKLQSIVDWSKYKPAPDAPDWLARMAHLSSGRAGALALLTPTGLSVKGAERRMRPPLDPAVMYIVGLADFFRNSGRCVAVPIPPAASHLPLLLAGASVLGETLSDPARAGSGRGVLLVSLDLDLRSRYCSLAVGGESLDYAHPGSRMRPDGSCVPLRVGRAENSGGVCFFLPGLQLPRKIAIQPALIVLDLRYARLSKRASDLADWAVRIAGTAGVLTLYTLGDSNSAAALRKAGFGEVPLDHAAIETCDGSWVPSQPSPKTDVVRWDLGDAPRYLDRAHEIVAFEQEPAVHETLSGINRLIQEHQNQDTPDLRRARWLLSALVQMPVPLPWYEDAARALGRSTIRRMISHLGAHSDRFSDGLGPVVQTLRMSFDQLYSQMEDGNRRPAAMASLLSRVRGGTQRDDHHRAKASVLVRDAVMERALASWLESMAGSGAESNLANVISCGRFGRASGDSSIGRVAVVNGPLPRRYRWIAGSPMASEVFFLCSAEEVDVVDRQLQIFYEPRYSVTNSEARERYLAPIVSLLRRRDVQAQERGPAPLRLVRPAPRTASETPRRERLTTVPGGFRELKEAMEVAEGAAQQAQLVQALQPVAWEEDTVDEESLLDDLQGIGSSIDQDDVECFEVRVDSRQLGIGVVWLQSEEPVDAIRPSRPGDLLRTLPRDLKGGDVILRILDGHRAGLFDRIVDLAEQQPQLQYLAQHRSRWRDAISRLGKRYASGGVIDYRGMLTDLRAAGAPIETEIALRGWIKELVIGPEKLASIVAVGKVVGDEAIQRSAREFDKAFRRIRGIRQGIGRRLSGAIRRSFKHVHLGVDPEPKDDLDDALGLPLDELIEGIDLAEVLEVVPGRRLVPAYLIGRFRPID